MTTGHEDHPVSCRNRWCHNGGPEKDMIRASKVLGVGKRGWFCQSCGENGGFRQVSVADRSDELLIALLRLATVVKLYGQGHDWMSCLFHVECLELLTWCEEKHDRYGDVLYPPANLESETT